MLSLRHCRECHEYLSTREKNNCLLSGTRHRCVDSLRCADRVALARSLEAGSVFADAPEVDAQGSQLPVEVGALHANPLGELANLAVT